MFGYIERLSKKSKNGDFGNFACDEINNLQAPNLRIKCLSTVSESTCKIVKLQIS